MTPDIQFYIELLKKRLPVMAVIFILCAGLGVGMALTMPPKFEAEAALSVAGAEILDADDDQNQAFEDLQIMEQRLMARGNLLDVARKYRVFAGEQGMSPDEIVEAMREATEIDLTSGRNLATIMRIGFESGNPNVSANVVNDFVTQILQWDAESRQGESESNLVFYTQRVERLERQLSQQSARIVEFKEANKDALPEGLEYRMGRQATLQERLVLIDRDRVSLREQRARLLALPVGSAPGATPQQQQLAELQAELAWQRTIFSDNNPKVKVLIERVRALESQISATGTGGGTVLTEANSVLDLQIAEIDTRIESLDEETRITEVELERLENAIERTPQVSIALGGLEREYTNTQTQYNQAVASRALAEQNVDVEAAAKGVRVETIEQASVPSEPTSPNRKLIAGGGVFAGTALALLFFTLTELMNRTIRRPVDLTRGLGVQPLATLPYLEEESVRQRRRLLKTAFVIAALIAIPVALWAVHTYYMPLDLLFETIGERIGL